MVRVIGAAAASALGTGPSALGAPAPNERASFAIATDPTLQSAGLGRPWCARVANIARDRDAIDPACALLDRALDQILPLLPSHAIAAPPLRVGLAVGTSSGGMARAEFMFADALAGQPLDAALAREALYASPFAHALMRFERAGIVIGRRVHVLSACAASTLAIGLATRWIEANACDVVIAGGYDALTTFVAAGFEALGAITAKGVPHPLSVERDGMALGEGAGLLILAREGIGAVDGKDLARIDGFGASGDAVHLTAPDREGRGVLRAAQRALGGVARSDIALISLHGTSTPFNDAMEDRALTSLLGAAAGNIPVHVGKASIGHTLGAAGVLESLTVLDALARGLVPPTHGLVDHDPALTIRAVERASPKPIARALKLSSAFGGTNAALFFSRADASIAASAHVAKTRRNVRLAASASVDTLDALDVSELAGVGRERIGRMDAGSKLALAAVGLIAKEVGRDGLVGAGIVMGSALATLAWNYEYARPIVEGRARRAEGRRFAYTTPNAAVGEVAIAFSLTGPNLFVGRGEDAQVEAREVAEDLLGAGDADAMVVVDYDVDAPLVRAVTNTLEMPVRFGARASLWVVDR